MGQRAKQLGGDHRTGAKFGGPRCSRDAIADHQLPVRALVHQHRRHPGQGFSVAGDLPLEFGWVGPVDPLVRQPERRGVNVEEHARAHRAIVPSSRAEFTCCCCTTPLMCRRPLRPMVRLCLLPPRANGRTPGTPWQDRKSPRTRGAAWRLRGSGRPAVGSGALERRRREQRAFHGWASRTISAGVMGRHCPAANSRRACATVAATRSRPRSARRRLKTATNSA